jgi:uncharacterized sporulation protein YeaH/YhbH (DUF444 family)
VKAGEERSHLTDSRVKESVGDGRGSVHHGHDEEGRGEELSRNVQQKGLGNGQTGAAQSCEESKLDFNHISRELFRSIVSSEATLM